MNDPLDDALGLPPMERPEVEVVIPEEETPDADYEFARKNVYRMIAKGESVLDELEDIARISQHPRAFEVYSNLFKAVVDSNKDLMGLKKMVKDLAGADGESGPRTVNNTLVATSDEILKMIRAKREQ